MQDEWRKRMPAAVIDYIRRDHGRVLAVYLASVRVITATL